MFERQIRLSRYDADKLFNSSTQNNSRMNSQHREISSPTRSRSTSPNDMAVRQRRTNPLPSTTLSLPVPTSYPDVVISHTPPTEPNHHHQNLPEPTYNENLLINKEKKPFISNRNTNTHEHIPLNIIVDESSSNLSNNSRPNLLLPSTIASENVDCQPLDFKSRLALFNRTNTENVINPKKSINKPTVHQSSTRIINEEKTEINHNHNDNHLTISVSRSVVNTAKAVTFFGGNKLNGNTKSSLPNSIAPPPPPSSSQMNIKNEQITIDLFRAPDIVGGNIKLNKSSIFSGIKKVRWICTHFYIIVIL